NSTQVPTKVKSAERQLWVVSSTGQRNTYLIARTWSDSDVSSGWGLRQYRVVSGRPRILARRADDFGAELADEGMQLVDIGAFAGAKAEMMQPDALLVEGGAGVFRRRRAYADRGASADAVIIGVGVDDRRHAEERQQF